MSTWPDTFDTGKATLYLDVTETSTNPGANTSVVSFTLRVVGNNASWNLNSGSTWSCVINGTTYSGTWTYDFRSDNTVTLKTGTQTITHNADGSKTIAVSGTAYGNSTIGTGTITSKNFILTDFVVVPGAPATIALSKTARNVTVTAGNSSGPNVTAYKVQYSTDGGTTWSTAQTMTSQSYTYTALAPATYKFRVFAVNADGNSAYTTSTSLLVTAGGKRFDGTAWIYAAIAKRWDGSNWVDLTIAKRWDGSVWTDLA